MRTIAIVVLAVGAVLLPLELAEAADQKQVLVLYATRRDAQVSVVGDRELPRILERGLPAGVDFYSEYIDLERSPDPQYEDGFRRFLRVKYSGVRFDLVIAVMDTALAFATAHRDELFPQAPIVFLSTSATPPRVANGTGILAELELAGTLELAAALQPDLRQVFVVTGASGTDKVFERQARAQLHSFESRFAVTYLSGLPMRELESRLATLPAHSIVYSVILYQDGAGENFHPLESLDRVVRAANAPVYSWVDSAIDHGIVGGRLKDQQRQTEALGALAVRVLQGGHAGDIPIAAPDLQVTQVDWRQLRRWGISESRVPAGTLVKFREPTLWDQYRAYIVVAVVLLIAQTALIAGLLVQRTRRQQAEALLRGKKAELRASYERIHDLGGRLLDAQESERARIARELHDDVGQQLAILAIDLELLGGARDGHEANLAGEALIRAQGIAKSVHDLSHRLHPARLRLLGLVSALTGLQRELSASGLTVEFTHDNIPSALPPELTLCVFRIVQEALQNTAKHSGASRVSVHLGYGPSGLALSIVDDGAGFDVAGGWNRGLGLVSMNERLEAVGGRLEVYSEPGAGTRLEAAVPLDLARVAS